MAWAMVTGASSGLGAEFARQLADEGFDVVVTGRDRERLDATAAEVRDRGRRVEVVVADLADRANVDALAARLRNVDRPVSVLVNNAGYGVGETFLDSTAREQSDALDVMVRAVIVLSHAAAGAMAARGDGGILNVSSAASLLVGSSYAAHKNWVVVFSEVLAAQLHHAGVRVTVTRPGFVSTPFQLRAGLDYSSLPRWAWTPAPPVVRESLRALRRGRVVVTPTLRYKAIVGVFRAMPRPLLRRMSRTRVGA